MSSAQILKTAPRDHLFQPGSEEVVSRQIAYGVLLTFPEEFHFSADRRWQDQS